MTLTFSGGYFSGIFRVVHLTKRRDLVHLRGEDLGADVHVREDHLAAAAGRVRREALLIQRVEPVHKFSPGVSFFTKL